MKNILIFNLTRMGDLLMTTPLIASLRVQYPEVKISVLSNSKFSETCKFIPQIDNIYQFDVFQFEPTGEINDFPFFKLYKYLEQKVEEINSYDFDVVINLTHSKLSAIFTSLLDVKDIRGLSSSRFGNRVIFHPWLLYFCNLVSNRRYNMFNLVDIYKKAGGVHNGFKKLVFDIPKESILWAEDFLENENIPQDKILFGFQPGSSSPGRRWNSSDFSRLGNILIKKYNATIILFGVDSEIELCNEIGNNIDGSVINAAGKTNIGNLSALLKRCEVLITNDTGTMHIASAVGIKICALFFTHAYVHETAPYGEKCVIVQADIPCLPCTHQTKCSNMVCKEYIRVADVETGVRILFEPDYMIGKDIINNKVQFYKPVFDEEGMIEFNPLIKKNLLFSEFISYAYRLMWKDILDDTRSEPIFSLLKDGVINLKIGKLSLKIKSFFNVKNFVDNEKIKDEVLDLLNKVLLYMEKSVRITEEILTELRRPIPDNLKVKIKGEVINELDSEIVEILSIQPACGPILSMFLYRKESLQGNDISCLANETLKLYNHSLIETRFLEVIVNGLWCKLV